MSLQRPAVGAAWDKRLTPQVLDELLQRGPVAFREGVDVDLLDYLEQLIVQRLELPASVAGLLYAPGVDDLDMSGPAWPIRAVTRGAGPAATVAVQGGRAVLSGRGWFAADRVIAPVPAGRTTSTMIEFRIDAAPDTAFCLRLGGLLGTLAEPGPQGSGSPDGFYYPVSIVRGYRKDSSLSGYYVQAPGAYLPEQREDRQAATLTTFAGQFQAGGSGNGGALFAGAAAPVRTGRWYRLEITPQTVKKPAFMHGAQGRWALYDADTGETVDSNGTAENLYELAAPRLGLYLGQPAESEVAPGYVAADPTVTVRRWIERRPVSVV